MSRAEPLKSGLLDR